MSNLRKIDTGKLHVTHATCLEGFVEVKRDLDVDRDVTVCGDLVVKGTINGAMGAGSGVEVQENGMDVPNTPHCKLNFTGGVSTMDQGDGSVTINVMGGAPSPVGLVGFWPTVRSLTEGNGNEASNWGVYSPLTGARTGQMFMTTPREPSDFQGRFNPGKDQGTIISLYYNENEEPIEEATAEGAISIFNYNTNIITYLDEDSPGEIGGFSNDEVTPIIYDSVGDRYLMVAHMGSEIGSQGFVYSFNVTTGARTELSSSTSPSLRNEQPLGIALVNNIILVTAKNGFADQNPADIFNVYNRGTGAFNSNVAWNGNWVFSGTQLKEFQVSDSRFLILDMAYDGANSRLYFLIDRRVRYIGYVEAASPAALETLLLSGNFDITVSSLSTTDWLNSIAYLPAPVV